MELSYWDILAIVAKAVAARVDPLKARVDAISDELSGAAAGTVVATGVAATPSVQATPLPDDDVGPELLPFDVKFDLDAEGMTIYAPDGCILVDGQPAVIEGSEEGYVPLSDLEEDEDASSQIVYAHVTKAAGGASWTATFDCNEYTGNDEDRFDFAVIRFLGWPRKERLCASVVSLSTGQGGGSSVPGNFEPVFEPDATDDNIVKLARVGEGFCPFGRVFIYAITPTVNASAKIATGIIYLYVTHPTSSSGTPTFEVRGVGPTGTLPDFADTSDKEHSLIPLYRIEDGAMTVDYRSCMSLTMRED